jgi:hypothetical protein
MSMPVDRRVSGARARRGLPIRWSLLVASLLVLAAIVGLRKAEPSFSDKLAPFVLDGRMEQRVEARNFAVRVKRVKLAEAYLTQGGLFEDAPRQVDSDGIWMSALVEAEPLQEPGYISAWLRTRDGRDYPSAPEDRPRVPGTNFGRQELATGLLATGAYFFDVPPDRLEGAHLRFFWGLSHPGDMDHLIDIDLGIDAAALRRMRSEATPVLDLTP